MLRTALGFACLLATCVDAAEAPLEPIVLPRGNLLALTVGASRTFSVTVTATDAEYRWTVDGAAVGTEPSFVFTAETDDIGTHEIAVTVVRGLVAARHVWRVVVKPPPVPTVIEASPSDAVVRAAPGERVTFRYRVASSVSSDQVAVAWTVDGTAAGSGVTLVLETTAGPAKRVRAVATSGLGVVQAREWRLVVAGAEVAGVSSPEPLVDPELAALLDGLEPEERTPTTVRIVRPTPTTIATVRAAPPTTTVAPPPPTAVPTTIASPPPAAAVPTTSSSSSTVAARRPTTTTLAARPPTTVLAALPTPPPTVAPPPAVRAGIDRSDVLALLERYARAYEARNVDELRRIGQVQTDAQADALARYFAQVDALEVWVRLLDVEPRGDGVTVRFRRRDRFRDPTGRVVDKETPPIEKEIRRTPGGLVFSPSS